MNILGYLQKIGRALMVPVAVLPAAAILMGVGYWIDPNGWGGDSALAAFLIKAGAAIIDNMSVLFAVGVAYGMSKDKDGSAALAGLVGFLVVTTLLSPGAVAQIKSIPVEQVPAAFAKISNQFVGILCGVIAAELYNRFSSVELHKALSFFSGRRLVPIVTSVVMIVVSFILMAVWPAIYGGLVSFGESIVSLGSTGAGIYAFFNRLLIPIGLHHALNSVFWFNVAGINDIPNFLGGQATIDAALAAGKSLEQVKGVVGMYQAGFFPIMIAAAFASFFTGVTEPLEFSFMFVAPVLYVIHAVLTGISVFIAASMQWMAGFGFSAGLVDMVLSSRNPLATNWYMLIPQGLVFFGLYYTVFRVVIAKLNLKTPGREDDEDTAPAAAQSTNRTELAKQYLEVLGGQENLVSIDACITRLRLTLKDRSIVDERKLKALGAAGVVKLGEQNLQVILGPLAEIIAGEMKALR